MELRDQLQATLGTAYSLERELGGGGMSRVFVAHEARLHRKVVVKVLSPELSQGISAERFQREIQLAASLTQANIVPVLSAGDAGGMPFFTMPFVEGESLRKRLARGPLSVAEAVSYLRDVARALAYAHERGIVHRDIKPDNVLLSRGTAVVTDFGIAKALVASQTRATGATLTQIGTALGTPAYMAPEQAAGDPDTDHRADIYAFGCMAYELLAGRPPFDARTPQRLLAAHMSETPPSISDVRPEVAPEISLLIARCMAKDAVERPQSADELLAVLDTASTSDAAQRAMPTILLGGKGMLKKALAVWAGALIAVGVLAKAAIVVIGLPSWVFPGALAVMALGLPIILFTAYAQYIIRRALTSSPTFTPGGTPSMAGKGTMATIAIKASPHLSGRRTAIGGAWAIGAFVVLVGVAMILRSLGIGPGGSLIASGAMSDHERIIVADFTNKANDSTLAPAVTDALRSGLAQSASLSIVPATTVRETLRRMQRPGDSRVDFALAREIATREGLKAVIDGEVLGLGGKFVISARLVGAQTGDVLASFRETASDAADIVPAVDRLSKDVRAKVGESLRSVQNAPPLEQVTTGSLEALKKFVEGQHAIDIEGDYPKGIQALEQAIALDTGFAMAYRKLGVAYANTGVADKAIDLVAKAYEHRDRLTDAERYMATAYYFQSGPQEDRDKAIAAYESLLDMQPDNGAANNLAILYASKRDFAKAEQVLAHILQQPDAPVQAFQNMISAQAAQGKLDDSKRTLDLYAQRFPKDPSLASVRAARYVTLHQYDSAQAVLTALYRDRGSVPFVHAFSSFELGRLAEYRGRLAEARRWDGERYGAMVARGLKRTPLVAALDDARLRAWFLGDHEGAVRVLDDTIRRHPLDSLNAIDRRYPDLVWLYATAGRPDRARALMDEFDRARRKVSSYTDDQDRHAMAGAIAFAEKRYADAVTEYRAADKSECVTCVLPEIARAYDLQGNADSAIAVFTRYVESPSAPETRLDNEAVYEAGAYKRLGELWELKGNAQKAAGYYAKFVDLWKNADPELQPQVAEVRKRLARLGDAERKG